MMHNPLYSRIARGPMAALCLLLASVPGLHASLVITFSPDTPTTSTVVFSGSDTFGLSSNNNSTNLAAFQLDYARVISGTYTFSSHSGYSVAGIPWTDSAIASSSSGDGGFLVSGTTVQLYSESAFDPSTPVVWNGQMTINQTLAQIGLTPGQAGQIQATNGTDANLSFTMDYSVVPEPSGSGLILALAVGGLACLRRSRCT